MYSAIEHFVNMALYKCCILLLLLLLLLYQRHSADKHDIISCSNVPVAIMVHVNIITARRACCTDNN